MMLILGSQALLLIRHARELGGSWDLVSYLGLQESYTYSYLLKNLTHQVP